jgi:murein DD-endopeptidase MepM/ murein hydrolase activator NlpD
LWEFHDGVDIAVPENTEVRAAADGVVTEARESATWGKLLKFRAAGREGEYEVMYAHLNKVLVGAGEEVKKGQAVALSGRTGLATGAHLHFGVYKNGEAVDPAAFLKIQG